jgi:hypothetical protein
LTACEVVRFGGRGSGGIGRRANERRGIGRRVIEERGMERAIT